MTRRRRPWLLIPSAVIWVLATYEQPLLSTAILSAAAFTLVVFAMPFTAEVDR